jgi:hypothetical protein
VANGLGNWRLAGAWAMLSRLEEGSFLVDTYGKDHR